MSNVIDGHVCAAKHLISLHASFPCMSYVLLCLTTPDINLSNASFSDIFRLFLTASFPRKALGFVMDMTLGCQSELNMLAVWMMYLYLSLSKLHQSTQYFGIQIFLHLPSQLQQSYTLSLLLSKQPILHCF